MIDNFTGLKPSTVEGNATTVGSSDRFRSGLLHSVDNSGLDGRLNVDIFLTSHRTAQDLKGLDERVKEADIIIPEGTGWNSVILNSFNEVSDGIIPPEQAMSVMDISGHEASYEFLLEELRILKGSRKKITFIDLPVGDPDMLLLNDWPRGLVIDRSGSFQDALDSTRRYLREAVGDQEIRYRHMISNFGSAVEEVIKNSPDLQNKKRIRILLILGDQHATEFGDLRDKGISLRRHYGNKPYIFGFEASGRFRQMMGKEISDDLAAKIFLERLISVRVLFGLTKDTQKIYTYMRKIISQFSLQQIEEIFEKIQFDRNFDPKSILKLPATEEEMDRVLEGRSEL